ncbi:dTDP-glucose 4,6-dehydratase [Endozoicomonas sp. SESOKO2]|uniref:dTDP-glucose 4,6-dehydratase n=1 Tax=Endozoicomonas sp. SESOKO2 TaxID=2828743 RepID=UPI002147EAA5|nr:dTDP-glucose 4,6-dehydratase [Endozoicomonas sp. SESOKO2]
MKSLLVTGGAGFIGANFVQYWIKQYPEHNIVVLDALTYAGNLASLDPIKDHPNYTFVHGNILDTKRVEGLLRNHKIDTLVHFAAESHVDRSITGPDAFLETNIIGTHSLLKAAKKVWLDEDLLQGKEHRFHHVSTDEVYGTLSLSEPAFTEETAYAPNSPYAASKASSDHLVRSYQETYGLKTTISNCSNNYGPYHFPEKLIPLVITNILHDKPLPIYGDGKQIRDWLYVEDHARGIELVLNKGKVGENYNIGGHNEWHNIDIVKLVCKLLNESFQLPALIAKDGGNAENFGNNSLSSLQLKQRFPTAKSAIAGNSESLIEYVKDRPGHDRRYAIDAAKTRSELGYEPKESFETGIRKTVEWYLNNQDWWLAVIDESYQD